MKHLIITLPAYISWKEYLPELEKVSDGSSILNFKVSNLPKEVELNKTRVYLVHRGLVKGWMTLTGLSKKEFKCTTTGKTYQGNFIERSGTFNYLDKEIPYTGICILI